MPLKLIGILFLVVLVALLTGFNLSNKCSIWFFHSFEDIPVFAALLSAFLAGVVITLPFTFGKKRKTESLPETKKKEKKSKQNILQEEVPLQQPQENAE
ncbi:hypothetical protein [uncultured Treponema sp.]|uniref:hypothetical protein n=1 Tax=Treponema sp. TaxID=166 RepID=UPI0025E129EA|nr:hypothetical protein [uncultured Treponema sp.]MEE0353059.1 hypothetical protein [Treponema sp.]